MRFFFFSFLNLLICFCFHPPQAFADFKKQYLSINYEASTSNGKVTNDVAYTSLEYKRLAEYIDIFPTSSEYHWYLDMALIASYYDLEDPLTNLGITNTPQSTADLKAANYMFEIGFSRRQDVYGFAQWILGARFGGFAVDASKLSGQTLSAQQYHVESSSSTGLTISAHSGLTWDVSDSYTINTILQIRKYYFSQFSVQDTVSGVEYKYPDFLTIGLVIGVSRGF